MDDPRPERPLYTPEFAARKRRSGFLALIMCLVMGAGMLALGLYARTHGGIVTGGPKDGHFPYPWWAVVAAGAFLTAFAVWALWRDMTRRS